MQITQQTPTVLDLQVQKYPESFVPGLAFSLIFALVGLGICFLFGNLTILKCNRLEPSQIDCEITSKNWLGKQTASTPVKNLQSAEVEVNEGSDGDTYRIVLITQNSRIPLTNVYSSGWVTNHYENNILINSFIQASEQPSLIVRQDSRVMTIFGVIFLCSGLIFTCYELNAKKMTHCVFDQESNQLLINRKNIFKSYKEEKKMSQIKQVEVTEDTEDGYTISLVLVKGDNIDLQTQKSKGNYDEIAQSINQFLNAKY